MVPRPVIPKDLTRYPDFPNKDELSGKEYQVLVLAYWKRKRLSNKVENHQRNLLTLKQTVGLLFLIYGNNVLLDYLLACASVLIESEITMSKIGLSCGIRVTTTHNNT